MLLVVRAKSSGSTAPQASDREVPTFISINHQQTTLQNILFLVHSAGLDVEKLTNHKLIAVPFHVQIAFQIFLSGTDPVMFSGVQ